MKKHTYYRFNPVTRKVEAIRLKTSKVPSRETLTDNSVQNSVRSALLAARVRGHIRFIREHGERYYFC